MVEKNVFADSITYIYDSLNRLIEVHYTDKIIHYSYDDAGNRTGMTIEILVAALSITSITPNNATVGGNGFILTVNGSNFTNNSVVQWNGVNRPTTFVNATQLTASIPAADIAASGTAAITILNQTTNNYSNAGQFTITSPTSTNIEGDIADRPYGSGSVNSGDVTQIRRFILGIDQLDILSNEYQKADAAPFETKGDGAINSGDLTQIRRYVLGVEPATAAAGPTTPVAGRSGSQLENGNLAPTTTRTLTVVRTSLVGNTLTVGLVLNTDGSKAGANALNADINYDPAVLSNPTNIQTVPGSPGMNSTGSGGTTANVDGFAQAPSGMLNRFRVLADLPASGGGQTFGLGAQTILTIDFTVVGNPPSTTQLSLTSIFVSSVTGSNLPTTTTSATVLVGPTASGAEIGGRIVTAQGRGVSRAQVKLTDQNGEVRYALTNPFGYYRFNDVMVGQTCVISVSAKGFQSTSAVRTITGDLAEVDFILQK
ncbi:MAG: carboxypeptidase regulatory-like domain-containing protein [Acidobacteriota bacterium]|nr:carboxypeptidase regulatory-like domain-containing protein [Acidobacteriota bacterium]